MSVRLPALSGALDHCCCLAVQVLGGEEILQLPKKTEELVPGKRQAVCSYLAYSSHVCRQEHLLAVQL